CGVLAAVWEPDIVENVRQLVFRDDLADRFFHLREINLGLLNACAGGGAHVQADLARVYLREEVGADERIERHARGADQEEAHGRQAAVLERRAEDVAIALADSVEARLERVVDAPEDPACRAAAVLFTVAAQ